MSSRESSLNPSDSLSQSSRHVPQDKKTASNPAAKRLQPRSKTTVTPKKSPVHPARIKKRQTSAAPIGPVNGTGRKRKADDITVDVGKLEAAEMGDDLEQAFGGSETESEAEEKPLGKKNRAKVGKGSVSASPGKCTNNGAEWTAAEDRIIFNACYTQITPVWNDVVAQCPGRSRAMRFKRVIQKKIEEAFKS